MSRFEGDLIIKCLQDDIEVIKELERLRTLYEVGIATKNDFQEFFDALRRIIGLKSEIVDGLKCFFSKEKEKT